MYSLKGLRRIFPKLNDTALNEGLFYMQKSAREEQNRRGKLSNSVGRELLLMAGWKAFFGSI